MTEKEKIKFGVVRAASDGISKFRLEAERCSGGIQIRIAGIIGLNSFSNECVEINNHGCRVLINGKSLDVTLFENNQIEIRGKVEEIGFKYGKN